MIGIEFVRHPISRERHPDLRDAIVQRLFREGILVLGAGPNSIRLCPPLVLTAEQAGFALDRLEAAVAALSPSS